MNTLLLYPEFPDFIQNSGITTAMVGLLQALPGTKLYERLKQEGRLIDNANGDNVSLASNILPIMGLETFTEGYQRIQRTIYSPENYYRRVRTFLREYPLPRNKTSLSLHYKMIFSYLLPPGSLPKGTFPVLENHSLNSLYNT